MDFDRKISSGRTKFKVVNLRAPEKLSKSLKNELYSLTEVDKKYFLCKSVKFKVVYSCAKWLLVFDENVSEVAEP